MTSDEKVPEPCRICANTCHLKERLASSLISQSVFANVNVALAAMPPEAKSPPATKFNPAKAGYEPTLARPLPIQPAEAGLGFVAGGLSASGGDPCKRNMTIHKHALMHQCAALSLLVAHTSSPLYNFS